MFSVRSVLSVVCALALAGSVLGQQLPDESYLSLQEKAAWLLNSHHVLVDLKISGGQQQEIASAQSVYSAKQQKLFKGGTPSESQLAVLDHQFASAATAILSDAQKSRLQEIALQIEGPRALMGHPVLDQVSITSAQLAKIKAIYAAESATEDSMDQKLAQQLTGIKDVGQRNKLALEDERLRKQRQRADDQKVLGILTADQQTRWATLQGPRF
jgi:predicted transcriptional regulator